MRALCCSHQGHVEKGARRWYCGLIDKIGGISQHRLLGAKGYSWGGTGERTGCDGMVVFVRSCGPVQSNFHFVDRNAGKALSV